MDLDEETWHLVKEVPKVLGFIGGSSDKPAPITDAEANSILNRVEEGVPISRVRKCCSSLAKLFGLSMVLSTTLVA